MSVWLTKSGKMTSFLKVSQLREHADDDDDREKGKKIVVRSAISYLSPAHQFRNSFLHCVISSRKTP